MNILFSHIPSDIYGSSRSLIRLSNRLASDGHHVYILLSETGTIVPYLKHDNIKIIIYKKLSYFTRKKVRSFNGILRILVNYISSIIYIVKLIGNYNIDIVHTNAALLLSEGVACKITKIPHVWHIREFFDDFPNMWKLYQKYIQYFSTKIICVSKSVAGQFNSKKNIIVINNGFPIGEFPEISELKINKLKDKYNLSDEILVGVIGRIKLERKGQDIFVKAIKELKETWGVRGVKFLIIGEPYIDNLSHLYILKKMIKDYNIEDNVILTGEIKDIKTAYAMLDIVVLPSAKKEPFGGVVIEAMAMSKPVIATAHGGSLEQVINGGTGILYEPYNYKELSIAMYQMINNEQMRIEMGTKGKKRFIYMFEFEKYYIKMKTVYENLVGITK